MVDIGKFCPHCVSEANIGEIALNLIPLFPRNLAS